MCGIVGVLGSGPVAGSIVDALKRLEYRGYDSAGVATLENGKLERRRAEGKLRNLEAKLAAAPLLGSIGIGHTRWATHGKPTETNAHPHASRGLIRSHRLARRGLFIVGGVAGGILGLRGAQALAVRAVLARRLFAGLILVVAAYVAWRAVDR